MIKSLNSPIHLTSRFFIWNCPLQIIVLVMLHIWGSKPQQKHFKSDYFHNYESKCLRSFSKKWMETSHILLKVSVTVNNNNYISYLLKFLNCVIEASENKCKLLNVTISVALLATKVIELICNSVFLCLIHI